MKKEKPKPGRPLLTEGEPLRRVNVMLDQKTVDKASDIGSGNVSSGLRIAVARITGRAPKE